MHPGCVTPQGVVHPGCVTPQGVVHPGCVTPQGVVHPGCVTPGGLSWRCDGNTGCDAGGACCVVAECIMRCVPGCTTPGVSAHVEVRCVANASCLRLCACYASVVGSNKTGCDSVLLTLHLKLWMLHALRSCTAWCCVFTSRQIFRIRALRPCMHYSLRRLSLSHTARPAGRSARCGRCERGRPRAPPAPPRPGPRRRAEADPHHCHAPRSL